jgi:hypothetical protein
MIEFMRHLHDAIMGCLEPVGIIAGLVFSGVVLRNDIRERRLQNRIKIVEGYREIWSALMRDPSLERILRSDVDLTMAPLTAGEDRLVRFIFHNMMIAYDMQATGQLGDIGDFEKDAAEFLAQPIPRAVWKEIARFQPQKFRSFVEKLL